MQMTTTIEMVVFDMAGTTVNEDNIVYKTLRAAINTIGGFDVNLEDVLAHGAGKEKKQAIKSILKNCLNIEDDRLTEGIFDYFLEKLAIAYDTEQIFPNTNAVLLFEELKKRNILRVLNTGYDRQTAESILSKLNWTIGREIDALVTASDVPRNRPFPDMIAFAIEKFNVGSARSVVKVGDSVIDIQEGQNAGCGLSIGITTGAHTREQLATAKPDLIIDDLIDLIPILEKHPHTLI